jgi:hypothetical protein
MTIRSKIGNAREFRPYSLLGRLMLAFWPLCCGCWIRRGYRSFTFIGHQWVFSRLCAYCLNRYGYERMGPDV